MTEATTKRLDDMTDFVVGTLTEAALAFTQSIGLFVVVLGVHFIAPTTVSWAHVVGLGVILLGVELFAAGDRRR